MATAAAIGQAPSGPVGLPALVGPREAEPFRRRLRPFLRLGRDQPRGGSGSATPSTRDGTAAGSSRCNDHTIDCGAVITALLDQLFAPAQHRSSTAAGVCPGEVNWPPGPIVQPVDPTVLKRGAELVERLPTDLPIADRTAQHCRPARPTPSRTNIHRRHLLGHEPSWSRPYSGVSDVPRHTPVSDVPKQDTALTAQQITPKSLSRRRVSCRRRRRSGVTMARGA